MTETPSVKKYYDYANQQIDEQAILDKYNAATIAQFDVQREQNRQAENKFYNQMYNAQKTAMDTIRQSNAAAVSSGASRGVQAANELSALLGLQEESVASATELAQASRQTAQEETAAVLENVLKAYQQAQQEKAQMVQHGIEASSVDVQQNANEIAAQQAQDNRLAAQQSAAAQSTSAYLTELSNQGIDYSKEYSDEGLASLGTAINSLMYGTNNVFITKADYDDYDRTNAKAKHGQLINNITEICNAYGIDPVPYITRLNEVNPRNTDRAKWWNTVNTVLSDIRGAYINK